MKLGVHIRVQSNNNFFERIGTHSNVIVFHLRAPSKILMKFGNLQSIIMNHVSVELTKSYNTFMQSTASCLYDCDHEYSLLFL